VTETNELQREQVRAFLLEQIASRFAMRKSSSWPRRFLTGLFRSHDAVYVFEHTEYNADRTHAIGKVQSTWVIDPNGTRAVSVSPESVPNYRRGMWYRFAQVHFYIAPAGDWLVKATVNGPRAGGGGRYRVVTKGSKFELVAEGPWWRS